MPNVHGEGTAQTRYDQMDLANPPPGIKLEACPNCKLPAVVRKERAGWTLYIHSTWPDGDARHRCHCRDDGRDLEVVMPVMPAEEGPCGST